MVSGAHTSSIATLELFSQSPKSALSSGYDALEKPRGIRQVRDFVLDFSGGVRIMHASLLQPRER